MPYRKVVLVASSSLPSGRASPNPMAPYSYFFSPRPCCDAVRASAGEAVETNHHTGCFEPLALASSTHLPCPSAPCFGR